MKGTSKNNFSSDYMIGACPEVFQSLENANFVKYEAYQNDSVSEECRKIVLERCGLDDAEVFAFSGGTQANCVMLDMVTPRGKGVVASAFSHINVHEAGAIEASGRKIIAIDSHHAKICPDALDAKLNRIRRDPSFGHITDIGSCYITQPTEFGAIYSRSELGEIHEICKKHSISLHIDGARLAYALSAPENDVSLEDIASFSDSFYIGGNKCGAMFGELGVLKGKHSRRQKADFLAFRKSRGALFAKSYLISVQFVALLQNNVYEKVGKKADDAARRIAEVLTDNGFKLYFPVWSNQVFLVLSEDESKAFKKVGYDVPVWDEIDGVSIRRMVFDWTWGEESISDLKEAIVKARDLCK